ncbi:hypothetical protein U9M48_003332 [Paspalum notatum var. saurae]|uniref:Uncharacterized protein n=1 Tax=Paspalum notatum var. saurae TaxID=547442 RepID=A0AAQ3PLB5_PASNO
MEIDSLRQEIQKRDAFLKAQEEYQKDSGYSSAGDDICHSRSCTGTSTATVGNVRSDEFFSNTSGKNSPTPQLSLLYRDRECRGRILTKLLRQPQDNMEIKLQSGQHIDPALGDFVNNLFASGGSGPTPASQVPCEFSEREVKLCVWTSA